MLVVLLSSIIAIIFAFFDSRGRLRDGMMAGMILATIIAAIRYNYGNDYVSYYNDFTLVGKYSLGDIVFFQEKMQYINPAFKDVGAAILYRLCKPVGFFGFVAITSIFQGCIYYQFIKENVARDYYWLAVFVYLFDFNNYVLQMSMIRQALVIALLVWSWHFLRQGKYVVPIVLAAISFTLHKSSIVFVPFVFLNLLSYKNGKTLVIVILSVTAFLWVSSATIGIVLGRVMDVGLFQLYNESYGMEQGGRIGLARLLLAFVPYLLAIRYFIDAETEDDSRYLVLLSIVGFLILPFSVVIPLISRLCYYFNIFMMSALPLTVARMKDNIARIAFISIFIVLSLYQYYDLFLHSVYTKSYATYHTVFGALISSL